ncbi:MAG: TerC family protein [Bacteriovoracaceae bacterium]|nr:TerC family protein [Bacteriovoracaceae bacterium]
MTVVSSEWWYFFNIGVICLLFLDLFVFHKNAHEVSLKESIVVSIFWVSVSLAFNFYFWHHFGHDLGMQFLSGYLIEKSLSVDNLFVILLIFSGLKIPGKYQHRVLFWGIFGAIIFRGLFILGGAKLINSFHSILYVFGAILLFTGIKLIRDNEDEKNMTEHWSIRFISKIYPITKDFHDQKFFVKEMGKNAVTPLFVALVIIELTDIVFAVDSIPAVFSVTQDAFVAYSSNILALLGLRALYFLVATSVAKLKYLKPGLSAILIFVGLKMVFVDIYHIPSWVSLLVISNILLVAVLSSWYVSKHENDQPKINH